MEEQKKMTVEMTAEEQKQFAAFRAAEEKRKAEEKSRADRETYRMMVDEEIERALPQLLQLSAQIKEVKQRIFESFKSVIAMKEELFKSRLNDNQRSHTFSNTAGNKRIKLGVYVTDGYLDTVEDGIAIVKEYIESLAKDEKSKALVNMVLRLLSRDAQGTLKASRIVQLRKIAEETGNDRFLEGVRIIEESYRPSVSKQFIRVETRNENNAWVTVPLGMTES